MTTNALHHSSATVPSFDSCFVSRSYTLNLSLRYDLPGQTLGSLFVNVQILVQISSGGKQWHVKWQFPATWNYTLFALRAQHARDYQLTFIPKRCSDPSETWAQTNNDLVSKIENGQGILIEHSIRSNSCHLLPSWVIVYRSQWNSFHQPECCHLRIYPQTGVICPIIILSTWRLRYTSCKFGN